MGNKLGSDNVAVMARIDEIRDILLDGYTNGHVISYAKEKWGIGRRQAERYISEAVELIEEINRVSVTRNLSLITSNLWKIYRKHIDFNPSAARQALMDIAKLRGLNQDSLDVTVHRPLADLTDEELASAIAGNE